MLQRSKKNTFLTHYLFAKMAKFFQTTSQFPLFRPFFCKTKVFCRNLQESIRVKSKNKPHPQPLSKRRGELNEE